MNVVQVASVVGKFFDEHMAAGLMVPDGWFGRPYDNLHRLTACSVSGNTLLVELDDRLFLSFVGGGILAARDRRGLAVRGFAELTWDWIAYGSEERHCKVFSDGEVVFMAPLGENV